MRQPVAAQILDGKALAQKIRAEVAAAVPEITQRLGRPPGLDVVLVGADTASQVYVRNKQKAAKAAGLRGTVHNLPAEASEAELLAKVDALNADPAVDGILVQLPVPRHMRAQAILERIDPRKDIDGFHPENVGLLTVGLPRFVPCTPLGIQRLLREYQNPDARGAGRGSGTLQHRRQAHGPVAPGKRPRGGRDGDGLPYRHARCRRAAREADILIVAMGQPEAVRGDWIKPGATVVDVGQHRRDDGSYYGDVRYDEAADVAGWITPVPGGVGPMTVAMLLSNTLLAANLRLRR